MKRVIATALVACIGCAFHETTDAPMEGGVPPVAKAEEPAPQDADAPAVHKNVIYIHKEDYRRGITTNGIWVDLSLDRMGELSKLSGKYVLIRGRFDGSRRGHGGAYSGLLYEISRCEEWNTD